MRFLFSFTLLALISHAPAQVLTSSKLLSGSGQDAASLVAVDSSGRVFIAGTTTSGDFPIVNGVVPRIPESSLRISTDEKTFNGVAIAPSQVYALASTPDGRTVLASAAEGIYRSTDGGTTWSSPVSVSGLAIALAIDPVNPANVYAAVSFNNGSSGAFERSTDGGLTWTKATAPGNPSLYPRIVIDPQNPSSLYVFFANGLFHTTDAGNTWQPILLPAASSPSGQASPAAYVFAPSQPSTIYATADFTPLQKSVDGGATWTLAGDVTLPTLASDLAVDPTNPNIVWAANGSGIQRSSDGGATFQLVKSMPGAGWGALVIDPSNPSHVFATNYLNVYATYDSGATWSIIASGTFNTLLSTPLALFAAGQVTPTVFVAELDSTLSHIVFSTFLGSGTPTGIAVDGIGNPVVIGVTASHNFPATPLNAFGSTFSSRTAGFVTKVRSDGAQIEYSGLIDNFTPSGVAIDGALNLIVTGEAFGTPPTTAKALQPNPPGACGSQMLFGQAFQPLFMGHGFAMKVNRTGDSLVWATYLAGTCGDALYGVTVDGPGNVYVTGATGSHDFPLTANAMVSTYPGLNSSGFVSEISADGTKLLYSSYFGAGANNSGNSIALDSSGNAVIGGFTQAKATAGAVSATHAAGCTPIFFMGPSEDTSFQQNDGFVMKMALTSSPPLFLATIGGSCGDGVSNVSLDGMGNIWISGYTGSADFPTMAPIGAFGPGQQGFVAELDPTGSHLQFSSFTGGGSVEADSHTGAYFAGVVAKQPNSTAGFVSHIEGGQTVPVAIDSVQTPSLQAPMDPAGFLPPAVAPGQLLILSGRNMGPAKAVFAQLGSDGKLPFTLAGVQVTFDGVPAALVSVGANTIECQVPFGLAAATVTSIQVQYQGQTSNAFAAAVVSQAISVLAVSNADGTANSVTNPAAAQSEVAIYLTGLGQTNPKGADGGVNGNVVSVPVITPLISTNGMNTQPLFFGPAPGESTAVFQMNVQMPGPPPDGSGVDTVAFFSNNGTGAPMVKVYVK